MDPNGQFSELVEKGQTTAQKQVADVAQRLKGQVLGGDSKPQEHDPKAAERTEEMIRDLYSPSKTSVPQENVETDAQKLQKVRQQLQSLHQTTYLDPLFAYEKKKIEPTQQEKQEQEKQQKMQELVVEQQKQNKDEFLQRKQMSIETRASAE